MLGGAEWRMDKKERLIKHLSFCYSNLELLFLMDFGLYCMSLVTRDFLKKIRIWSATVEDNVSATMVAVFTHQAWVQDNRKRPLHSTPLSYEWLWHLKCKGWLFWCLLYATLWGRLSNKTLHKWSCGKIL